MGREKEVYVEKDRTKEKVIRALLGKLNLRIDEKIALIIEVCGYVKINQTSDKEFMFETPIAGGTRAMRNKTIKDGLDKLLEA